MVQSNLAILIYLLALASFFMLVGRLVTTRQTDKLFSTNPLHCLVVGMAVWYVWFLVFAGLFAVHLGVVWWFFAAVCFISMLFFTKSIKGDENHTHVWSGALVCLAIMSPVLWWASYDVPVEITEFSQTIKNAAHLHAARILPGAQDVEFFNITHPNHPIGHLVSVMPAHFISDQFMPAAFAVFNVLLLVLAASHLLQVQGIGVKWSNMPLVTAGALLGTTALNPFFQAKSLLAGVPTFSMAAALLVACSPLFRPAALPQGWGALPSALALSLVVGLHPLGWVLAATVAVFWLVRSLIEENVTEKLVPVLFSVVLLVLLPALVWLLWQAYLQQAQIPALSPGVQTAFSYRAIQLLGQLVEAVQLAPFALVWLAVVVGAGLLRVGKINSQKQAVIALRSGLVLPAVLALVWVGVGVQSLWPTALDLFNHFAVLQFVLLVPLWRWFLKWYLNSDLKAVFWRMPWAIGLLFVCVLVVLQLSAENRFKPLITAPLHHTLQVAKSLKKEGIPWGSRIAVIDSPTVQDKYAHALSYGLANHAVVVAITPWVGAAKGNRGAFHAALREQSFDYLWVHSTDEEMKELLSQKLMPAHSYLFQIAPDKFQLKNVYPHPAYEVVY